MSRKPTLDELIGTGKKQITMEQAVEFSSDPEELRNMIASGGTPTTPPGQRQAAR